MSDLVERLRHEVIYSYMPMVVRKLLSEAALAVAVLHGLKHALNAAPAPKHFGFVHSKVGIRKILAAI